MPSSEDQKSCVDCPDGEETKDGKVCYTKITDCEEYEEEGKCAKCNGKVPSSNKATCEACPDGKETKDGKTCVDKNTSSPSSSSFINFSVVVLLFLFTVF